MRRIKPRPPMLTIVCGETGVGKTYRTRQEVKKYLNDNEATGKSGRKVLAFDTNDDDYVSFKTVAPEQIHKLQVNRPRRIRPFNADGSPMSRQDKKDVVKTILKFFKDGLILLDDIDDYMVGEKGEDMISALCTLRHKGVDIIFTHQSIGKITRTAWQNCTWLRLHHQVDDITYYKERIPKYPVVRIAQLIVDEQYELADRKFQLGEITEEEFDRKASFFVYVNIRKKRLYGCSKAAFVRAARRYIDRECAKEVKMMMAERDAKGKPVYKDRGAVVVKMVEGLLGCWVGL